MVTDDLKLPVGRRLFTVCRSMKDGERSGFCAAAAAPAPAATLEEEVVEEETGVTGIPPLLVLQEPVGVGAMSPSAAGMSMERCGRRCWSPDASGFGVCCAAVS